MRYIKPCCAPRQMSELRASISKGGSVEFMGYGDLSLTELLPAILTRYGDMELLIAAPSVPDQAAEVIARWMDRKWSRADGQGRIDAVGHLTLVADLSPEKSPKASQWLEDSPWGQRLTAVDTVQEDTVILLPDFAVTGPVNMRYGHNFTATATTVPGDVAALWERFSGYVKGDSPEAAGEPVKEEPEPVKEEPAEVPEAEPEKEESPKKEVPGGEAGQQ